MAPPKPFEVDANTYFEAHEAIRDILFMYYDMDDYRGFGHSLNLGKFDPLVFLNANIVEPGYIFDEGVLVLQEGSAVKILCEISDEFDEQPRLSTQTETRIDELLSAKSMIHLPEAETALRSALLNYEEFNVNLGEVYESYVLKLFRRLAAP